MKTHHAIAIVIGALIPLIFNYFFEIWKLDCLLFIFAVGLIYFNSGLFLGATFPGISWRGGLLLLVPSLLIFLPLGILSNWFAGGWGFAWKIIMNCDIYLVPAQITAAVLGSFLGSLFPVREKSIRPVKALLRFLFILAICVFSGAFFFFYNKAYTNKKYDIKKSVLLRNIKITPYRTVRIGAFEYKTILADTILWMAGNLNHDTRDTTSRCYDDDVEKCEAFGRLYTWEGAVKACAEVGWRLPTKEEWEALIHFTGNYKFAFDFLYEGGESGFNARLGGSYQLPDGAFANLGEVGSYWSSSSDAAGRLIWKCGFRKKENVVWTDYFPPDWYFSCRCVKDVNLKQ